MADVIRQWIKGQLASAESESHEKECDAHMDFSPAQGRSVKGEIAGLPNFSRETRNKSLLKETLLLTKHLFWCATLPFAVHVHYWPTLTCRR
jgi:O-succinylbenzoate synthase